MRVMVPALAALVALSPAAAAGDVMFFQTPSGNIACLLIDGDGGFADCGIAEMSVRSPVPERPADCDLDYGNRFQLQGAGSTMMGCYGDTVRGANTLPFAVLPYGAVMSAGSVSCASAQTGLTCTNAEGHGFFLSKARQELF